MKAKEYFAHFHKLTCTFCKSLESDELCGRPVAAVYVTDDNKHVGRYICLEHAEMAEIDGDGPVFWFR